MRQAKIWDESVMASTSISENVATSGGGIVPLCLLYLAAIYDPNGQDWIKIGTNTLAAVVSTMICYVVIGFLRDKRTGHRWFNLLALVYFGLRVVIHCWVVFDRLSDIAHVPIVLTTLSNCAEVVFGVFYYVTRRDLMVTYRRSEEQRQANIRRLDNIGQAALNLQWITRKQSEKSSQLTEIIENVGRGS